jgi:hypothetical protein
LCQEIMQNKAAFPVIGRVRKGSHPTEFPNREDHARVSVLFLDSKKEVPLR